MLVVCGTICGCDDYEDIAGWGETHLETLRQYLPYKNGVPSERWLTILMNRINPALFADAFAAWVRATLPGKADMIAIDGKTSRRSHDKSADRSALHLVSAFASTAKLVLAQEAVPDKANELAALEPLVSRISGATPAACFVSKRLLITRLGSFVISMWVSFSRLVGFIFVVFCLSLEAFEVCAASVSDGQSNAISNDCSTEAENALIRSR